MENKMGTMPTLEELKDLKLSVGTLINHVMNEYTMMRPAVPIKPRIAEKHACVMEEYDKMVAEFREYNAKYEAHNKKLEAILIEYIVDASDLSIVPEQYRDKVFTLAWTHGHLEDDGLFGVHQHLCKFVEIFR